MIRCLAERPWLFIVAAFVILVSVWTCFITLAVRHAPQNVEIPAAHAGR
jgi:hypothetical protein